MHHMSWLLLIVIFISGCGEDLSLPRLGITPPPDVASKLAPLPANAKPADYDVRIAALTGMLAQEHAEKASAVEREQEAQRAAWVYWSRLIAIVVIPLAVIFAGVSIWLGFASMGCPIAGIAVAAVLALQAWAEAQAYILPVIGGVCALAIVAVAVVILRRDKAIHAGAALSDAFERGDRAVDVAIAKGRAKAAQLKAGVHGQVQRLRGKITK